MLPVEKIVGWVKDKPVWWQHSIRLALEKGSLDESDLRCVYNVALHEHDIEKHEEVWATTKVPIDISGYSAEKSEVRLAAISDVINVGSLAGEQALKIGPSGLTVIYGDNGAGKSSYAKILKHACLTRGGKPNIIGNALKPSRLPSSANISFLKLGKSFDVPWGLSEPLNESLKSIRVFDTDSADHFVSNEDELGYKPSGLHLLEALSEAIEYVKRNVTEETMGTNGLSTLPVFSDTEVGRFVRGLSSEKDSSRLSIFKPSESEIQSIPSAETELSELRLSTPKKIREVLSLEIKGIEPLLLKIEQSVEILSKKFQLETLTLSQDYQNKSKIAEKLRESFSEGLPLPNIGGELWQNMWKMAESFFREGKPESKFPPRAEEECPFCLQTINDKTEGRLDSFKSYLENQAAVEAKEAKSLWDERIKMLSQVDLDTKAYVATISQLDSRLKGFASSLSDLLAELSDIKNSLLSETIPEGPTDIRSDAFKVLRSYLENRRLELKEIQDNDSLDQLIEQKSASLLLLKDKVSFLTHYDSIESNLQRHIQLKKYKLLEGECNPRPVTDVSAEINKESVIQPLIAAFQGELKKFGFNRFQVETKTRGSRGSQLMKLQISGSTESQLSKVASEGEQRCIAIACFLAEIEADERKSAVVFDDPVNSLSHHWSARVAKRLVQESLTRQVVVLTHDIVFYKLLHEFIERNDGAEIHEVCLERSRKVAGLVRSSPPWDALPTGKRIKHLRNVMLRKLRKIYDDGTETEFRKEAYIFYGFLREAWERLVEEKLLNKVVTRFGRGIQTQRLRRLTDLSQGDFDRIDQAMDKCSTYFRGHDSAPAAGDPYPTIDEIDADLKSIEDFNDELHKTRKRS